MSEELVGAPSVWEGPESVLEWELYVHLCLQSLHTNRILRFSFGALVAHVLRNYKMCQQDAR